MNRRGWLSAFAVAALSAAAASHAAFPWIAGVRRGRKSLLIAGSGMMYELNRALAKEFAALHPDVDMVVEKGGSLSGLIALKRGAIDVAAMERDLTVAEDDLHTHNFLIARGNIAIVVNRKSPVTALSDDQIRALFTGGIDNWKRVGGPDAPVRVVSRARGSNTRRFVEEVVLDGDDIIATAKEAATTKELTELVAADPFAIGYLALQDKKGIADVGYIDVDGVAATRATILSGHYPYTHSLYLLLYGDKSGPAADFVAFARGPAGQKIVEQQLLIPTC